MKLSFHEYLDKMRGCWNGKNIGGTLGTPFEGMRGLFDIQYYSQPLDKPLPNDDLDLQLVWLNAVEKYGRNINRELLGEYWLSFIYPDCAEYGAGKNNLRRTCSAAVRLCRQSLSEQQWVLDPDRDLGLPVPRPSRTCGQVRLRGCDH